MYYSVKGDPECTGLVVTFGTEEEIQEDQLEGEGIEYGEFQHLQEKLDDTGELCEDYLIVSNKYKTKADIPTVKGLCEQYGFIENKALDACGWG